MRTSKSKPLVVRLAGGLGNQLFQISFAHNVRSSTGRSVLVDTSWYRKPGIDEPRDLLIDPQALGFSLFPDESFSRTIWRSQRLGFHLVESTPGQALESKINQRTRLISGYHQSFTNAWRARDFLRSSIQRQLANYVSKNKEEPYVAVHSRIGDYFGRRSTRDFGVTEPNWLLEQAESLRISSGVDRVVVFSDSPGLFVSQARTELVRGVQFDESTDPWHALLRMAQAHGIVMSNSTLSWFSAFTATCLWNRPVSVVFPTPWFTRASLIDSLLPAPGWMVTPRRVLPSEFE